MSQYTTGEIAKQCNVTVRTVQFYDTKGLLKPSELTEGGRRLYSDVDLDKLRKICLLKSLGLSLDAIKGILQSKTPDQVLLLLLDEQQKVIDLEIKDKQKQSNAIRAVKESVQATKSIPIQAISDIERMMNTKKKLRRTKITLLVCGIAIVFLLVLFQGYVITWEFAYPILIFWAIPRLRKYLNNATYTCAVCGTTLHPTLREMLFSRQTPKTRKLTCSNCKTVGYCVQISRHLV